MTASTTIMPTMSSLRRWSSLGVLLFAQFVLSIDLTVLNVALPDLTADLRPTSDQQLWIVDAYSLVLAGLLVSASSLSDRWGRKRMLLAGTFIFCLGSALIMFASTPLEVIAIRAFLGLGAAMIMPTTISMIRNIFTDARERAFALAAWSVLGGLGMAVGPIIGGGLLETFNWHAAFLVNIPLMGAAFIAGIFVLPEIYIRNPGRWDALAAVISLVGMSLLMWGIKHLAAIMGIDASGIFALVAGAVLMIWFVLRCLHSKNPLLDVSLFKNRTFTGGVIAALGAMFSIASLLFLLAQWLQLVDGCTPLESGLKLLPLALAALVGGGVAPSIAMKAGAHRSLVGGLLITAIAMIMLLPFMNDLTYPVLAVSCALVGLGTGALAIGSAAIMCATPPEKASSAAAFEEIAYDLGNVLGVAIMGSIASIIYRLGLSPDTLANAGLDSASIESAMQSFSAAVQIASTSGATELLIEGAAAFSNSIVITSALGGAVMLIVTFIIWRIVPKDLDITESDH